MARKYTHTIDVEALESVCPELSRHMTRKERVELAKAIGTAMHRLIPTIGERAAAYFIGQCAHESGEFRWPREIWGPTPAQSGYWSRRSLQGAGPLYRALGKLARGIGWIQTTGRANLRRAAKVLGRKSWVLLARQGDDPYIASLLALIWWRDNFPAAMPDWTVDRVSRQVNLGNQWSKFLPNGMAERRKYTERAMKVRKRLVPRPIHPR